MNYQIQENCRGCGKCAMNCPVQAIVQNNNVYKINKEKCINCGKCYSLCPFNAIKILDEQSNNKIITAPVEKQIDTTVPVVKNTVANLHRTGLGLGRGCNRSGQGNRMQTCHTMRRGRKNKGKHCH